MNDQQNAAVDCGGDNNVAMVRRAMGFKTIRCTVCRREAERRVPLGVSGTFFCRLGCWLSFSSGSMETLAESVEGLLGRLTGELREECRQRLTLALLSGEIRLSELTPADVARLARKTQKDLHDHYNLISFESETGQKIAAMI